MGQILFVSDLYSSYSSKKLSLLLSASIECFCIDLLKVTAFHFPIIFTAIMFIFILKSSFWFSTALFHIIAFLLLKAFLTLDFDIIVITTQEDNPKNLVMTLFSVSYSTKFRAYLDDTFLPLHQTLPSSSCSTDFDERKKP